MHLTDSFNYLLKGRTPSSSSLLDTRLCMWCMICVCSGHTCRSACVEVKGQLVGTGLSFYHVFPGDPTQATGIGNKWPYLLSHRTCPLSHHVNVKISPFLQGFSNQHSFLSSAFSGFFQKPFRYLFCLKLCKPNSELHANSLHISQTLVPLLSEPLAGKGHHCLGSCRQ